MVVEKSDEVVAVSGQVLKGEGVGEFARADAVAGVAVCAEGVAEFTEKVILVGPDLQHLILKIGLQDTV